MAIEEPQKGGLIVRTAALGSISTQNIVEKKEFIVER